MKCYTSNKVVCLNNTISIMQWNVLAQKLATHSSFPYSHPDHLQFQNRFPKIINYIKTKNPSLLTLQEVDRPDLYSPILTQNGYQVQFQQGQRELGMILAFKQKEFELISLQKYFFTNSQKKKIRFMFMAKLQFKQTEQQFYLICSHLKAKKQFFEQRIKESKQLVSFIQQHYQSKQNQSIPLILCGDFNFEPTEKAFQIIKQIKIMGDSLISLYPLDMHTTVKKRQQFIIRTIDYIFLSNKIRGLSYDSQPSMEQIGQIGFPNDIIPSDHLYLYGTFTIL